MSCTYLKKVRFPRFFPTLICEILSGFFFYGWMCFGRLFLLFILFSSFRLSLFTLSPKDNVTWCGKVLLFGMAVVGLKKFDFATDLSRL
jgi:hypothetical protein